MIILRLQQLLLLYYIYNYTHMYTVYISNQLLGLFRNRNPHRQCLRLHDAPGCCPTELVISTHQKGLSFPNFDAKKQDTFEVFLDIHPISSIFPAFSQHVQFHFPSFPQMFRQVWCLAQWLPHPSWRFRVLHLASPWRWSWNWSLTRS